MNSVTLTQTRKAATMTTTCHHPSLQINADGICCDCGAQTSTLGTLRLSVANGSWVVDFSEAYDADRVHGLFGTTVIATPFTATAEPERVRAVIAAKNPRHRVVLGVHA